MIGIAWVVAAVSLALGVVADRAAAQTFDAHIGGIVTASPEYPASKNYRAGFAPYLQIHAMTVGPYKIGGPEDGLSVVPSLAFVPSHRGVSDIYEVGGKIGYRWGAFRPWIEARQQLAGATGRTGRIGVDYILSIRGATIETGPRVWLADRQAMDVDFAGASPGVKSYGWGALARYPIDDRWMGIGIAEYQRYTGPAGRLVDDRDDARDVFTVGLGLAYRVIIP